MFKKFFTLLFALLWCTMLIAQDINEVDPNGDPGGNVVDTPGDILYTWDVEAITGEIGRASCRERV